MGVMVKDYSKVDAWLETWGQEMRGGHQVGDTSSLLGRLMSVKGFHNSSEVADIVEQLLLNLQKSHVGAYNAVRMEYLSRLPTLELRAEQLKMTRRAYKILVDAGRIAIATHLGVEVDND